MSYIYYTRNAVFLDDITKQERDLSDPNKDVIIPLSFINYPGIPYSFRYELEYFFIPSKMLPYKTINIMIIYSNLRIISCYRCYRKRHWHL
jgi:hypothetical protein